MSKYGNRIKKNLYVGEKMDKWIKEQAESMGLSESAFMTMALNVYRQQQEMQSSIPDLGKMIAELKDIQGGQNND